MSDTPTCMTIEASPDATLVVSARGTVVASNRAFELVLGYPSAALRDRPLSALLPARILARLGDNPIATLCARAEQAAPCPLRIALLRHAEMPVEIELAMTASAADNGCVVLAFRTANATLCDLEDRPHGAVSEAEAHRVAFEFAPIGIFQFNAAAVLTACNDAFVGIIGSSRRALIGLDLSTLPNEQIVSHLRRTLAGERTRYEGEYQSVTGQRRSVVRADFAPVRADDGAIVGGVGIVEDVTERRRLQARLAQSDRLASVGTLSAGVAHEINNPLAYVLSNLDYARRCFAQCAAKIEDLETQAKIAAALDHARDGAERVQTIVRDLKTFSRGGDESRANVYLERAIEAALTMAHPLIRGRARVLREFKPTPPVWADEGRLAQVFLNLVINAAQAVGDEGPAKNEIRVVVGQAPDGRVFGEVSDTGAGIAPEHLPRVFEPFFTTRASGVGTGFGLSVCHGLITGFGGEITVESQLGKGATFRVLLPPSTEPEPRDATSERRRRLSRPRRRRVLVVDDETLLARSIELQLQDEHDVEVVSNGTEALARLERAPLPDLILCDMMLPDISGMDVFERALALDNGTHERFVFMTGGSFSPKLFKFLQDHAVPCLEKPFTAEQLREVIDPR